MGVPISRSVGGVNAGRIETPPVQTPCVQYIYHYKRTYMAIFAGRAFKRDGDGSIGDPLEGVTIAFDGPQQDLEVTTSSGGTYRAELPQGRYNVVASKQGFRETRTLAILRRDQQTLNVFLEEAEQPSSGLAGRAFERNADGTIGEALEGVSLAFQRTGFSRTVRTGDNGRYRVELPAGTYTVSMRKEGYSQGSSRVIVRSGFSVFNPFLRREDTERLVDLCDYAPGRTGQTRTSEVILPGNPEPVELTYEVYDGIAVLDGGVILGPVDALDEEVRQAREAPSQGDDVPEVPGVRTVQQGLLALRSRDKLWDGGILPYQFDNINQLLRERIEDAMEAISNNTNIEFVPASDAFTDRVIFRFSRDAAASSAELGRQGGKQYIWLNERFDVGGIVHEILHALGILHEQSRNDRDAFVQINDGTGGTPDNILQGRDGNFRKRPSGTRDIGPYDYDSIMHYSAWAFTSGQGVNSCNPPSPIPANNPTIQPRDASIPLTRLGSARCSSPFLSPGDIAGLNDLYPVRTDHDGGHLWGPDNYATDVAFGDVDGDGVQELIVTRRSAVNGRYYILNDGRAGRSFGTLFVGGRGWGDGAYATCCAAGDIDGDGRDEVIIGRRSPVNMRWEIRERVTNPDGSVSWNQRYSGGDDWGDGAYTTGVAIGIDGSGQNLVGVARRSPTNARFYIYSRDSGGSLNLLFSGGADWGDSAYATNIAFGDVDGDGELEVGVTRHSPVNSRFIIYKAVGAGYSNFQPLHSGGTDWGGEYYATSIAFGDVDGDGRDEVGVTRFARENGRFFVFDSADEQFRLLHAGGKSWGAGYYATDIAMGDVDGDGRAEVLVARKAGSNARFFLFDDGRENYIPLMDGGRVWGDGHWATAVALGNAQSTSSRAGSIAVARKATSNARFMVQEFSP